MKAREKKISFFRNIDLNGKISQNENIRRQGWKWSLDHHLLALSLVLSVIHTGI